MQTDGMRMELATEPGDPRRPNEDFASVAIPASGQGGALVLLDGVTPPTGDDGCLHTVPWFTARLGGALAELSGSQRDLSLRAVLSAAITRTAAAHRQTCDLSHPRTPQATVVVVRWDEERVEHLVLSDSALLVESPDGAVRAVLDERLGALPPEVERARAAVRALPEGTPERALTAREYVAAVEALRNTEGGFFTAAADPEVAARAVTGERPRTEVSAVAALTDGVTRWVDRFGAGDWPECFALLRKAGPQELIDRVRALENAAHGRSAARGKRHDDATAVFVEF